MKTFDEFIYEEQIRRCRSLEKYEVEYLRTAWEACLKAQKEPVAEVPCSAGLEGGILRLEGWIMGGAKLKFQDGEWWIFDKDGEGIISDATLAGLIETLAA